MNPVSPLLQEVTTPALLIEHVQVPGGTRFHGHSHDQPHLCVVLHGGFEEQGSVSELATAGTLRVSPAHDEHSLRFGAGGARCLLLELGHDLIVDARLPAERTFLHDITAMATAVEICNALDDSPVLIELRVLELLAQVTNAQTMRRGARVPAWLARVRDALHAVPGNPPATAELAADAGLHPVYVARAFRQRYGCSIATYARRLRLDHARSLLAESDRPIATIAAECGFADQSHLTRALRHSLDITPAALRRRRQVARIQDSGGCF